MAARPWQGFRYSGDFMPQRILITRQPLARKPIRQGKPRRGIALPRAMPESFGAQRRRTQGSQRWRDFLTKIKNRDRGQQLGSPTGGYS
jgi:hypothetical protein